MSAESFAVAKTILPPLPETVRGYGIHIDISKKDERLIYCNGNNVVIRALDDHSKTDIFSEHKTHVHVAKFSPSGEWVASGDDKGRVIVWGTKNKIIKNTVQINQKILDISWSDDGQRIAAVGQGNEQMARVFSWDTGNALGEISNHTKPILSVSFKPSRPFRVVTASEDNTVNFYSGPPFKFDHSFTEHENYPNCVRFSPDGSKFVSVGADYKIFVFDGSEGKKILQCDNKEGHRGSIYSVSWSPDSKQFLTASGDKTAKVWDAETGNLVKTFTLGNNVEDMQVSTAWSAHYMLTVSLSGAINILDPENLAKPKRVIQGHQHPIRAIELDAKSNTLYSSDQAGYVCRWDLGTFEAHWMEGKGHGKGIVGLSINSSNEILASAGMDDKLRLNELKSHSFSANAIAAGGMPTAAVFSRKDPDLCFFTVAQGHIHVMRKGHAVSKIDVKYRPNTFSLSQDDTELAVAGDDKKVHLYSINHDTLKEAGVLSGDHTGSIETVSYSPSGQYLVSADKERSIYVWDRSTKEPKNPSGWQYHSSKITTSGWSPSSTKMATGSQDQHIIVWSTEGNFGGGDSRKKLEFAHPEGVVNLMFLNDNVLISSGNDRCLKLWDV